MKVSVKVQATFLMRFETAQELHRNRMDLLFAVPTASNISSSIDVNEKNT